MSLLILFDSGGIRITGLEVLSRKLVRVSFLDEMVINEKYYDPSTYTLQLVEGSGESIVKRVLTYQDESQTALEAILETQNLNDGNTYRLFVEGLTSRAGKEYEDRDGNEFKVYRTKLDSILRSIPSHYDTRPGSNLGGLLTAIALSDNTIGGGRKDDIDVS